jgi:hypothetical protein
MTIYEMLSGCVPYEHSPTSCIELAAAGVRPQLSPSFAEHSDADLKKVHKLFHTLTSPNRSQRLSFVKVDRELVRIRLGCDMLNRHLLSPTTTPRGRS